MTPWTMPPWQVAMFTALGQLPDKAAVLVGLPRQHGTRLATMVVRKGQRRG